MVFTLIVLHVSLYCFIEIKKKKSYLSWRAIFAIILVQIKIIGQSFVHIKKLLNQKYLAKIEFLLMSDDDRYT